MLRDLFVNASILIAFLSIGSQIFRNHGFNPRSPLSIKIISGVFFGMLGIVLMKFSTHFSPDIIIDFRYIPIIVSALSGGYVPVAITGLMIGVFRVINYGVNNTSLTGLLVVALVSIASAYISKLNIKLYMKWIYAVIFNLITFSFGIVLISKDTAQLPVFFGLYWTGMSLLSFLSFYYMEYLESSGEQFRRYKEESKKDFLTGLNNVRQFNSQFKKAVNKALETSDNLALLFIDIDHFKKVNDTYGHHNGDLLLRELSSILIKTCRSGDLVSRNGGEEFSVLLYGCSLKKALEVGERIREAVEAHQFQLQDGININITVSVGIANYPETTKEAGKLFERADNALLEAKRSGRNKVVIDH